jgi:hypothetical protein
MQEKRRASSPEEQMMGIKRSVGLCVAVSRYLGHLFEVQD